MSTLNNIFTGLAAYNSFKANRRAKKNNEILNNIASQKEAKQEEVERKQDLRNRFFDFANQFRTNFKQYQNNHQLCLREILHLELFLTQNEVSHHSLFNNMDEKAFFEQTIDSVNHLKSNALHSMESTQIKSVQNNVSQQTILPLNNTLDTLKSTYERVSQCTAIVFNRFSPLRFILLFGVFLPFMIAGTSNEGALFGVGFVLSILIILIRLVVFNLDIKPKLSEIGYEVGICITAKNLLEEIEDIEYQISINNSVINQSINQNTLIIIDTDK